MAEIVQVIDLQSQHQFSCQIKNCSEKDNITEKQHFLYLILWHLTHDLSISHNQYDLKTPLNLWNELQNLEPES